MGVFAVSANRQSLCSGGIMRAGLDPRRRCRSHARGAIRRWLLPTGSCLAREASSEGVALFAELPRDIAAEADAAPVRIADDRRDRFFGPVHHRERVDDAP